jgi:SP family sugar:H+ symporter-like MFS transporter
MLILAEGYDTGLIGGILALDSFKQAFGLDKLTAKEFASVSGNIVSILQLGCFIGALVISPITQRIGRRPAMLLTNFIFLFGSLLQVLAGVNNNKGLAILYAGRLIGGMGVGAVSMLVPIYISENAPKHIRGRCVGMMQLFIVTGIALSNWINYSTIRTIPISQKQWRIPFGAQMIPGGLLFIAMFFMNESPRWLAEHRGREEALSSLAWVRGSKVDDPLIIAEVEEIIQSLKEEKAIARPGYLQVIREIIHSKSLRWRSLIGLYIQIGQQFTGELMKSSLEMLTYLPIQEQTPSTIIHPSSSTQ